MSRVSVEPRVAYRILNHGATTLVTTRADNAANIMAAQWVMPIDTLHHLGAGRFVMSGSEVSGR